MHSDHEGKTNPEVLEKHEFEQRLKGQINTTFRHFRTIGIKQLDVPAIFWESFAFLRP